MAPWLTQDPVREDLGRPSRRPAGGRHLPTLHRPASGPRGDQPAGLRGPAADRTQGAPPRRHLAVPDHNVPTTDRSQPIADEMSRIQVETLDQNCREFGIELFDMQRRPPGHRARHRPRAGLHPARHHHRLRRQPHQHAWRLRGPGLRHRHLRGRARAGHPDAGAEAAEDHADQRSRASCRSAAPPRT